MTPPEPTHADSSTAYYHASVESLGDEFEFDEGGIYEKVENGQPEPNYLCGEYIGWKKSETQQLCASCSPEAAAFAKLKNLIALKDEDTVTIFIYKFTKQPDIDLTDAMTGDFGFIEEIRYNKPSENPIHGELTHKLKFPKSAIKDVDLAYMPEGPYIVREWAKAVKDAIKKKIETGEYPDSVSMFAGVDQPVKEAYMAYPPGYSDPDALNDDQTRQAPPSNTEQAKLSGN